MSGKPGLYLAYSRNSNAEVLRDLGSETALDTIVSSNSLYKLKSIIIGAEDDLSVFMVAYVQFKDDYRFHRVKSIFNNLDDVHRIARQFILSHKAIHPQDSGEMSLWENELNKNHNYFNDGLELSFGAV